LVLNFKLCTRLGRLLYKVNIFKKAFLQIQNIAELALVSIVTVEESGTFRWDNRRSCKVKSIAGIQCCSRADSSMELPIRLADAKNRNCREKTLY
jgi:hypothetical protein